MTARHWMDDAACLDHPPEWWQPSEGQRSAANEARALAICATCPVLEPCRDLAVANQVAGVCGGLTPVDRGERPARSCGTVAGWHRHRRRSEPPCDPCRLAWNRYQRDYQHRHRTI